MNRKGFVFAMNRHRDSYQVPLALHEAGLLREFVTDFYLKAPRAWMPAFLRGRHHPDLRGAVTRWSAGSLLAQYGGQVLGLPMHRVFPRSDCLLARTAARRARALRAPIYAYSSYLPDRLQQVAGLPAVSFEYHPHPAYCLEILKRDAALHPEVSVSLAEERANASQTPAIDSWRHATHIVCASTMTRRTLEFAGCPSERMTVIPYGIDPRTGAGVGLRENAQCRFLFVGQGIQRKGLHHLLKAWRQAQLKQAELTLVCYRMDPGIEALARQLQSEGLAIRLLPHQSREALQRLYRSSDVFAMPSLVEGFGLVYLEALREGCHVIATGNTGMPDLNLDAGAASLVDAGNIDQLTAALRHSWQLWEDDRLDPQAIAANASRRSWADFRHDIAEHARSVWASAD